MKVICIETEWETLPGWPDAFGTPTFGSIYVVIIAFEDRYGSWYCLEGFDEHDAFGQGGFAPVSNIDEKEFERNYNKELA